MFSSLQFLIKSTDCTTSVGHVSFAWNLLNFDIILTSVRWANFVWLPSHWPQAKQAGWQSSSLEALCSQDKSWWWVSCCKIHQPCLHNKYCNHLTIDVTLLALERKSICTVFFYIYIYHLKKKKNLRYICVYVFYGYIIRINRIVYIYIFDRARRPFRCTTTLPYPV